MPPPPLAAGPVSHTVRLPLPRGRVFWIWMSVRFEGGSGITLLPAGKPLKPGAPSTTSSTWPLLLSNTRLPWGSNIGMGVGIPTHDSSQQNTQPSTRVRLLNATTTGPWLGSVAVGEAVAVPVGFGVPVGDRVAV